MKTPGGVFLTLVKTCATAEQRKEIFQVDKEITARRVKEEKKRKANEKWKKASKFRAQCLENLRMRIEKKSRPAVIYQPMPHFCSSCWSGVSCGWPLIFTFGTEYFEVASSS